MPDFIKLGDSHFGMFPCKFNFDLQTLYLRDSLVFCWNLQDKVIIAFKWLNESAKDESFESKVETLFFLLK